MYIYITAKPFSRRYHWMRAGRCWWRFWEPAKSMTGTSYRW